LTPDLGCAQSCPPRYFMEETTRKCVRCPYDCYMCNKLGSCISCNETSDFRMMAKSAPRCLPLLGYFDNLTAVSVKCPTGCSFCTNLTYCSTCFAGYFLSIDNLCYSSCPSRTYANNVSRTCQACYFTCLTCSQPKLCASCSSAVDFR